MEILWRLYSFCNGIKNPTKFNNMRLLPGLDNFKRTNFPLIFNLYEYIYPNKQREKSQYRNNINFSIGIFLFVLFENFAILIL